ncbi:MAG: gliding motility-associated C-terminal domain-containing protein [Chitinophagales bacterium]|nr:gliding motility-associated C-terminal domain-containing protein [Chitinophagales bacterium]
MRRIYTLLLSIIYVSSFGQINCPNFGGFNTIIFNGCTPLPYNYSTVVNAPTVTPLVDALSNAPNCVASIENNQFFAFQATATTMSFTINPGTVTGGLQAWIFSTADCINPTILACNSSGFTTPITLTSNQFVPGQIYYIMIDGYAGATGNYSFSNITPAPGSGGQTGSTFPLSFVIDSASCGLADGKLTINASNATPPYSYSINGSPFQSSNTFTGLAGGTYSVLVRDNNNCTSTATVTIPNRETRLPGDVTYCASAGPITITAVGGTQFSWRPTTGIISASPDSSTIVVAPTQTTEYIVNSNIPSAQCKSSDTIKVTVANSFNLSITASKTSICLNESSTLTALATPPSEGPYTFSWTPVATVSNPSTGTTIARPTTTTTYKATVISKDGCKLSDSITINVQGFGPKVRVTPSDNYVCPGKTVQLNSEIIPIQTGPSQDPANACPNCTFPFPYPQVGTSTTSTSSVPTPFRSFWHDGRVQYLYLASELLSAGMRPGVITDIQFFVTTKGSGNNPFNGLTVKMGGTNLTQQPANTFVTQNMFVVHTSNYTTTANSWNTITLDVPFNWDGQSNLIIEVCYDNSSFTNWDYVQYSTAFTRATHYADRDNAVGCTLAWEASSNLRPNIRFVYGELPTSNLSLQWTPPLWLSSDTAANPFATINGNIAYTLTVFDGNCYGDTTIQMFVDTAVAIQAIDDYTVCRNNQAVLTAKVLNKVQPTCSPSYTVAPIPFAPLTSSNKTPVPFSTATNNNNRNATINLPFSFKFHCTDYNSIVVNENGFITFNTNFNGSGATPTALPNTGNPNNTVAGLWLDLNANPNGGGNGTISYFVDGSFPYRKLVIEWNNVLAQGQGNNVSFQIILFETTNVIEVHLSPFSNIGGNKTIGVENSGGTAGIAPAGRNGSNFTLSNAEAWRFNPNIAGAGFVTFQWSPSSAVSAEFGDTVFASPSNKTKYYVSALFSNGCVTRDSVEIDVKDFPYTLSVVKDTICPGQSSTLTFNGAATTISWQPAATLSSPTSTVTTATPPAPTTYYVNATNADGCTISDSIKVFVKLSGAVSIGKDTNICYYDSLRLTPSGSGYVSYLWQPGGQTTPSITVNKPGEYYVTLNDGLCSFNSNTINVDVILPVLLKAFSDTTLCSGQSAIIRAENGYSNYIWNTGAQTNTITVSNAGLYYYSANDADGCRQFSDTAEVKITIPPTITLTATPQRICPDKEATLNAGSLPGIAYEWNKPNDNNTYTGNTITAVVPGRYRVTASDNGCKSTDSIEVLGANNPIANIGDDINICACDTSIVLNSGSSDPDDTYLWSNNAQTSIINVSSSGNNFVTVTSQFGCKATDSVEVNIRCLKGVARADKHELIKGQSTNVFADSISYSGQFEYTWIPASFLNDPAASSTSTTPDSTIVYLLKIKDIVNGCETSDTVKIKVVLAGTYTFPSAFSPNRDGINDRFAPYLPIGSSAKFPFVRVYNRWGQLVYECLDCDFTQPGTGWDGTYDGQEQPAGVYHFVAEVRYPNINNPNLTDSKIISNPLTLIK